MLKEPEPSTWREARRESARAAILTSAWDLVRRDGLAGLSLRELARHARTTTPTVYAYFPSKNAIFDAMFSQAAESFASRMGEPFDTADTAAEEILRANAVRFASFCTEDVARYQLLFQHSIPGFTPSPESYAPAVRALDIARGQLGCAGVHDVRHLDLWTALMTGLVDQQVTNDPGGQRWTRLIDDAVGMFLAHCRLGEPASPATTHAPGR